VAYAVKLLRSDLLVLPAHPDSCTTGDFERWCAERVAGGELLAVDLFSGCGGLSLGLSEAGWTPAVAVDHDAFALQTHRANFPGLALDLDLGDPGRRAELTAMLAHVQVDLVAGGPPCQPFSRAGRNKIRSLVAAGTRPAHDDRSELWRAFLDVVLAVRPRAVLMENVPDMALMDDLEVVRIIVDELEEFGYHTQVRLVGAWQHGVPQHRRRLILLARLDGDTFPWPGQSDEVTVRQAIGDLPRLGMSTGARQMTYTRPVELSDFAARMRDGADAGHVWDHMTRPVREDDRQIFERMTPHTRYTDIAPELRRYRSDTYDDRYKRLDWDRRSRSITAHIAKDGYWYIHPAESRTLTVREAARIQTFPDRFRFAGGRSHAFRQIGNAVPPLLGEAAAVALRPAMAGGAEHEPGRHRVLLRSELSRWADERSAGPYWPVFPGEQVTTGVAAVLSLLDPQPADLIRIEPDLRAVRAVGAVSARLADAVERATARSRDDQVAGTVEVLRLNTGAWPEAERILELLGLSARQEALFRLLSGDDVLLAGRSVRRVAARVLGTSGRTADHESGGLIDLAQLVGSGPEAPRRMAAVRLVSQLYCHRVAPMCLPCPLSEGCLFARRADPPPLLF
jgi:DNA (cytosine-5)-methyltransferase 1